MARSIRDRLGFVLHTADIYNHYRNVVRLLPRGYPEMVLLDSVGEDREALERRLVEDGVGFVSLSEVDKRRWRYRYLVTNHPMQGGGWRARLPERIGATNVRFMYALGKARHNFASWNMLYDVILCHGPWQVERLGFCRHTVKLEMGYPRYDGFAAHFQARDSIRSGLGVGEDGRPVVLWVPTWQELCSIDAFLDVMVRLQGELGVDVVVKPHPLSVTAEPERVERLRRSPLTLLTDSLLDITELYAAADCVVSDYGGTIFSALYVDRPIVLLDSAKAEGHHHVGAGSPDVVVRGSLPHVDELRPEEVIARVREALDTDPASSARAALRDTYFAPLYGRASQAAAGFLSNLDRWVTPRRPAERLLRMAELRARELATGERRLGSLGVAVRRRLERLARRVGRK